MCADNVSSFLDRSDGTLQRTTAMIAEGNIHEDATAFRFEAHDQSLNVFAPLAPLRGGHRRWMNPEVESLVVQHRDRVSDNLVGKFADGFADQIVRALQFCAGHPTGKTRRSFLRNVEYYASLNITREPNLGRNSLAPVCLLIHRQVLDGNG